MKKLNRANPPSKKYGPVVLWADNLDELISTLKVCESTLFVADDIQYDSVEEFVRERKGRKPRKVRVSGERPYIGIDLDPLWAKLDVSALSVSKDELLSLGLFKKLDAILSRCERKPKFLFSRRVWFVAIVLNFIALAYNPSYEFAQIRANVYLVTGFVLLFPVLTVLLRGHSVVLPRFAGDVPSFFQRNKDSIVVAVVSALIGSLFGVVATKAVDKVWPNAPPPAVQANPKPR